MTDNDAIAAILKSGKEIPVLNLGVDHTAVVESVFPVREHPHLLRHGGKTHNTPLNSTLSAREIRIPTDPKDPHYKDRHTLSVYKRNALTLTFRGHRNNPVPLVEWEQYYLHLLPLVLEHPKLLLSEAKLMTAALSNIYRASSDYIGDASLTALQQQALKTKSLCLPLLADNPFEKGANENDDIQTICLEDLGLNTVPSARNDPEMRRKFDNLEVQYSRNMNYLRELINHTFLRSIYQTSSKQAKLEFKEVQRSHHNDEAAALLANANHVTVKFTANHIIKHIIDNCTCSNDRAIQVIQSSIDKKIRYKGQSLLDWYQHFVPIVNKYQKAASKAVLNAAEQKTLWKDHFVKQINLAELVLIISVRTLHLTANEVTSIEKLNAAEFDDPALLKLLTKLNVSFEKYEPDKAVMTYLHQHSRTLNFELDFRNPKEYVKEREPRSTEKQPSSKKRKREDRSKRPSDNKRKSPNNKNTGTATTVPYKLQCKRPDCIARRTSTNHAHDKCRFKDKATEKPYPNIGKAPPKRIKKTNHSAASKGGPPFDASKSSHNGANTPSPAFADTRTCYICNAKGHIATTCPQKQANKNNAKVRLKSNKSFMALWKTHFPTEPENLCATRILDAWDEPNYCTTCLQPEGFNHVCRQEDRNVYQHVQKVKNAMTSTSMLNDIMQAHEPYTSTEESTSATIDYTFFSHAGGQGHGQGLGLTSIHRYDEEQSDYQDEEDSENDTDNRDAHTDESQDEGADYNESDQQQTDDEDAPYDSDNTDHDDSD